MKEIPYTLEEARVLTTQKWIDPYPREMIEFLIKELDKKEERVIKCRNCKFWKRWGKHPELSEQNSWGNCERLIKQEMFIAYVSIDEDSIPATDFETHKDFGCALWKG